MCILVIKEKQKASVGAQVVWLIIDMEKWKACELKHLSFYCGNFHKIRFSSHSVSVCLSVSYCVCVCARLILGKRSRGLFLHSWVVIPQPLRQALRRTTEDRRGITRNVLVSVVHCAIYCRVHVQSNMGSLNLFKLLNVPKKSCDASFRLA